MSIWAGNRLYQVASIAIVETKLAARAAPRVVRHVAPVVAGVVNTLFVSEPLQNVVRLDLRHGNVRDEPCALREKCGKQDEGDDLWDSDKTKDEKLFAFYGRGRHGDDGTGHGTD